MNLAVIVGRLGNNPIRRDIGNHNSVCNFSVATSEKWTDKNTLNENERTEWHRVCVYGKLSEVCAKNLKKGSQVLVEGRVKTREYEDDNGKQHVTEIVANSVTFL